MNIFQKFYLTFLVIFMLHVVLFQQIEQMMLQLFKLLLSAYLMAGITSNNVLYFAYDRSDINSA